MVTSIGLVLFYFITPLFILFLCKRFPILTKLGAVLIAYFFGLLVGGFGLLPDNSEGVQEIVTMITIPVAIPLLLFSTDIRAWAKLAKRTFISMIIAMFSVVIFVVIGYLLFRSSNDADFWKVGGLLIGVYTGGTPNLAALKLMLDVDNEVFLLANTYDMLICSAYFFMLISVGHKIFGYFLPKFEFSGQAGEENIADEDKEAYWGILKKANRIPLLKALGISVLIFAVAGSTTLFIPENSQMIVVILIITTLGIAFSFIPSVNRIEKSFELGMYLILVFSLTIASMVDVTEMVGSAPNLFYYILLVIFGSLTLQVILSRFFTIDRDTVMITSTALIFSPPFVPVVAAAIKNKEVVVSGLTVGIIGYAVGNYLGLIVAEFLKTL
jgi:uncharacterized membrane protein